MRKLATIQKIKSIIPIPEADRIEMVEFESIEWKCVTRKGEFKVGDAAIYIEIDSIIPFEPWSEFLRNKDKPEKPIRLKTKKMMKKYISQGIALPISILSQYGYDIISVDANGHDVTEILGIEKYMPPVSARLSGQVRGPFPSHLPKTDEERIQSSPTLLEELRGLRCYSAVKADGTSCTCANISEDEPIHVCSRNLSLQDGDNVYWDMYKKYRIEDVLNDCERLYGIQFECVGPGVQKNRLGLEELQIMVFDVRDIQAGRYLDFSDLVAFCTKYDLPMVPIDNPDFVFDFATAGDLLKAADGFYDNGHPREGIVVRPLQGVYSPTLQGRLSVKAISNEFLLRTKT